jgi:hypothetical protein
MTRQSSYWSRLGAILCGCARRGRFTSPERSFEAAAGEVVGFTCQGPLVWPQAAAAVIMPGLWIGLKQR